MRDSELIIVKEIFPNNHEKIAMLWELNPDLRTIVADLLECHQLVAGKSSVPADPAVPSNYWEELYEDLKKEALDLVTREMTGS